MSNRPHFHLTGGIEDDPEPLCAHLGHSHGIKRLDLTTHASNALWHRAVHSLDAPWLKVTVSEDSPRSISVENI
jgi:hypothetical protein